MGQEKWPSTKLYKFLVVTIMMCGCKTWSSLTESERRIQIFKTKFFWRLNLLQKTKKKKEDIVEVSKYTYWWETWKTCWYTKDKSKGSHNCSEGAPLPSQTTSTGESPQGLARFVRVQTAPFKGMMMIMMMSRRRRRRRWRMINSKLWH